MESLDMAGHLIRRLHQQSTALFVQRTQAAGFDLTPIQFAALGAIHNQPGTDQARRVALSTRWGTSAASGGWYHPASGDSASSLSSTMRGRS